MGPIFLMKSDPLFKIYSDWVLKLGQILDGSDFLIRSAPVFKIYSDWSDPDSVFKTWSDPV